MELIEQKAIAYIKSRHSGDGSIGERMGAAPEGIDPFVGLDKKKLDGFVGSLAGLPDSDEAILNAFYEWAGGANG